MTPRTRWVKHFSSQVKRSVRWKGCNAGATPQFSYSLNPSSQDESEQSSIQTATVQPPIQEDNGQSLNRTKTIQFRNLHNTLQRLPQTYKLEPLHPDDCLHPQGSMCDCPQPCFLHRFPSRVQYPKTLDDDLPKIAKASDNRFYPLFHEYPRWPGIGGDFLPRREYPPWDDIGGPFIPFLAEEEYPRYHTPQYEEEPLIEYDDFVVSMGTFFAGYRDADPKRYGEAIKFIRDWDIAWNKITRTKRKQEQWNQRIDFPNEECTPQ